MRLLDMVRPEAIIPELESADRNGAIRELVAVLADCHCLAAAHVDPIAKSIISRERSRGTTGFGKGVAVPHAKLDGIKRICAAVGRSSRGIDFASLDGEPVYAVFLIISPESQPAEHLQAMDLVFRNLQQEKFRKFLRQADAADKIYDLLREADEKLLTT